MERGVYQKKLFELKPGGGRVRTKSESASASPMFEGSVSLLGTDFAEHLSVKEDSYTKYMLSNRCYAAGDDDDDEFDSDDDLDENGEPRVYESDDNQSNASESDLVMDTSKNRHFYVWKLQSIKKRDEKRSSLLRQVDIDSDADEDGLNDSSDYTSSESDTSDGEDAGHTHDSDSDDEPVKGVTKKQQQVCI